MKIIIFLLFNFLTLTATCQISVSDLNNQDKKFFQTITAVSEYLKNHKTIPLAFHESETYSNQEAFYDTVITKFFSKEKMLKIFENDTSHLAVAGKVDWLRHILNETDYYLDIIPSDSIFVRHYNSKELLNTLEVYLIVNSKDVPMFLWHFDPLNALLVSVSFGAIPENEAFMSYLKRQKNYYEFPDPKKEVRFNQ
jgi:hypothetical protein